MATYHPREYIYIEIDANTEIVSDVVRRRRDRKLREYLENEITFPSELFSIVECLVDNCFGHQHFGYSITDNTPLILNGHEPGKKHASYIVYKNQINRPIRPPRDGDVMIHGIRWDLNSLHTTARVNQGMFDCLLAYLKFKTLQYSFCLECLFMHNSGIGLLLERLIKTVLLHIVPYGRFLEKQKFSPISLYQAGMTLRFRRAFWGNKKNIFKTAIVPTSDSFREDIIAIDPEAPETSQPAPYRLKTPIDVDFAILRHLNEVSTFNCIISCTGCVPEVRQIKKSYIGIIRKSPNHGNFNMALGTWNVKTEGYFDPIWMWSLFGNQLPNANVNRVTVTPFTSICKKCSTVKRVHEIQVPSTTWLLMSEISLSLSKSSLEWLDTFDTYIIGSVTFRLGFVLLYNSDTGEFSSLNYHEGKWFHYDDFSGIFKSCRLDKVRYREKSNLRVFYFRETMKDPHACMKAALERF